MVGGGGVVLVYEASITMANVSSIESTSRSEPGGGFANIYKSTAIMSGIKVVDTFSFITGGFINCLGSPEVVLTDITVSNALAREGGLAYLSGSTFTIRNVNATYAAASQDGGFLKALGSSGTVTDVVATHSTAGVVALTWSAGNGGSGGSALAAGISSSTGHGGLVFSQGSFLTMSRIVAENTAAANDGGLWYLDGESQVKASEIVATLTSAGRDGGIFHIAGKSTLKANVVQALNTTAAKGGGLICATGNAVVHANDVMLEQTKAGEDGGLLHASDGCTIDLDGVVALGTSADRDGGFIHASAGSMIQMDGVFAKGTSAGQNGGLIDAGEGCTVEIANSVVTDTSAGKHGGLVHIPDGYALVQFNNVTGKTVTAATSAGLSFLGKQARLVLQSSHFLDVVAPSATIAVMDNGAQFQTLHVVIGVGCGSGGSHIINNGTGGLALRDLKLDDTCAASSAALTDQVSHGALVCAQQTYKDATSGNQVPICGPATVCTDAVVLEGSSATGPQCACASGALRPLATVSFVDAPYLAGDFCECDHGTYPAADGSCTPCELGTYKLDIGSGACLPCGQDRTTLEVGASSTAECVCDKLFVLDGDSECTQCNTISDGAVCETPNTTIRSLVIKPEYWRISSTSLDVRKCRGDTAYTPCAGGAAASCADHHGGPKCEVCTTEGYYFDKADAACKQCPEGAMPVIIGIVGLFSVISAISLLRFLLSTRIHQFKRIGAAARLITRAVVRLGPSKVKLAGLPLPLKPMQDLSTKLTRFSAPRSYLLPSDICHS